MTYLAMAEELLRSKVYPHVAYRLPLGLVGRHSKAQPHRELLSLHLDWQRPIPWLELDPWDHDVVSYNNTYILGSIVYYLLLYHLTFVRPNGYLSMDDPWVEILDDVPRTVDVSSGRIQVADEDHWSSNFEL